MNILHQRINADCYISARTIESYEGVPIVPILKLNSFIREMKSGIYEDQRLELQAYYPEESPPKG
ncbi:MAG: hypothetical protein WAX02_06215 [Methanothrix sp.]